MISKTELLLFFIVMLLCVDDSESWWRRRRRHPRGKGHTPRWSGKGHVQYDNGRLSGTGSVHYKNGRWGASGHVHYHDGRWGVSARITFRGKRDVRHVSGPFKIQIKLDECLFGTYDLDDDDKISAEEVLYVFENHKKENMETDVTVEKFIKALDCIEADGYITESEFKASVSKTIDGC